MKLIFKNGGEEKSHTLGKEATTIGRSENNVIHLDDNSCSRNHCIIEYRDKNYQVVDLRSYNGIKVNGDKVTSHTLAHGDVITVGKTVMKVVDNFMFANDGLGSFKDIASNVGLLDADYTGRGTAILDSNGFIAF